MRLALVRWNRRSMHIDRVAELQRWQDSGAVWQIVSRKGGGVTVALLRCDGGEEVDRFSSDDARLLEFIGDRWSSAD
jgi:hypothetical protein